MIVERCDSTNEELKKLAEAGAPAGTWIAARTQDHGRGRQGRRWESLSGNLFLSYLCRIEGQIEKPALWTWVPLVAAISVAKSIHENFHPIHVRIKWPNDLWRVSEDGELLGKLGGILCEAGHDHERKPFIVIGIGLNCRSAPQGLDQMTTSLSDGLQRPVEFEEVLSPVLEKLGELTSLLIHEKNSIDVLRTEYDRLALLRPGLRIQMSSGQGGQVQGLGPSGELLVSDVHHPENLFRLFAEDIEITEALKEACESLL